MFYGALYGQALEQADVERRLAEVRLTPRSGQSIGTFSRGMRQRLGLARALIGDPALLIVDEPTNGLDPRGRREMHDLLLQLARHGAGVLLCTHLLDDVERLCERIGIIVEGKTILQGGIGELVNDTGHHSRFRLRLAGQAPPDISSPAPVSIVAREGDWLVVELAANRRPEAVWRELIAADWPITEIRQESGGLEALYLSLTRRTAA